jgi:hypothetical protein
MPPFVMRWSVCSYSVVSIEVGGFCVFNLSRSRSLQIGKLMTETWLFTVYGLRIHCASFCFIAPSRMKHGFVVWFHCKFNC